MYKKPFKRRLFYLCFKIQNHQLTIRDFFSILVVITITTNIENGIRAI